MKIIKQKKRKKGEVLVPDLNDMMIKD
jgi:hypothetical protein